eukprot:1003380-Pyramimonas_sp.AAC.3
MRTCPLDCQRELTTKSPSREGASSEERFDRSSTTRNKSQENTKTGRGWHGHAPVLRIGILFALLEDAHLRLPMRMSRMRICSLDDQ